MSVRLETPARAANGDYELGLSSIKSLHVILTFKCNYRCTFCFQPDFKQTLDPRVWREKLVPLYPQLRQATLHGGEPTVGPLFPEFVALVSAHNDTCRFNMFTNGARFDDYWIDLMLRRGGFANFSLNAHSREVYDKLHGHGRYDDVHANLAALLAARRDSDSPLSVETSMVVLPENVAELPEFTAWAIDVGLNGIRYFVDMQQMPPATDETLRAVDAAIEIADRALGSGFWIWGLGNLRGKLTRTPIPEHELESFGCRRTFTNLYVAVNGNVSFCNFLEGRPIGNLTTQDLEEIWNSEPALAQRGAQDRGEWTYCISQYCGPAGTAVAKGPRTAEIPLTVLDRRR
jgi:MoaA/NifB/PqqE/SkfB family radical SAM enzyme